MVKNSLSLIISLVLSVLFMDLLFLYFFLNLGDITLNLFSKYLAFKITDLDRFLVWLFPLLLIYPIIKKQISFSKSILIYSTIGITSIFASVIVGVLIAIISWPPDDPDLFIPHYFLPQPFDYYWTIFFLIGIAIPFFLIFKKNPSK